MAETTPIYLDEFKAMHPADLADRLQRMQTEEARHILTELPVDAASALKRFTEGGEKADTMSGKEMYAIVDMLKREHGAEAAALEASLLKVKRQLDKKIMLLDWVGEHVGPAAAEVERPLSCDAACDRVWAPRVLTSWVCRR